MRGTRLVASIVARCTAAILVFEAGVTRLSAQAVPQAFELPARVRVTASTLSPGRQTGTLITRDASGIRFVPGGKSDTLTVALEHISLLERSLGRTTRTGHGALIGLVIGAGIGTGIGIAAASGSDSDELPLQPAQWAVLNGVAGAALGALVGAVIGRSIRSDRWTSVPLRQQAFKIMSGGGRFGFRLTLKF